MRCAAADAAEVTEAWHFLALGGLPEGPLGGYANCLAMLKLADILVLVSNGFKLNRSND